MGLKLGDELNTTPPKLCLSSLPIPSHKTLPSESPWALTPPLHPMVSIPFKWEEAPGQPKATTISSPCKPKIVRCLELPPRLLIDEAKLSHTPHSPTTVLDGPRHQGRSLSDRFFIEGLSPKNTPDIAGLVVKGNHGLDDLHEEGKRHFGPWRRWASANGTKWNQVLNKGTSSFPSNSNIGSVEYDMDIEVKITRFRKRSRRSLYKLSHTSSQVLENILECLKQILVRRRPKREKPRTEASCKP